MGDVRPSIVVEGVGKRFELQQARSGSVRELLARRQKGAVRPESAFWALQNIGFTVEPGHPLAIIGHNGSGKSTLLKLLTGILAPTRGTIDVRGPGRGADRSRRRLPPGSDGPRETSFSTALFWAPPDERSLRTSTASSTSPVWRSSSTRPSSGTARGCTCAWAFSVAAHLEPEILLIDEVLAVGDAQFQRRCLTHLKDFVRRGGSVVFVSHAMSHVRELCDRCVWLDHGKLMGYGDAGPLIEGYEALVSEREDAEFARLYPKEFAERERQKRAR